MFKRKKRLSLADLGVSNVIYSLSEEEFNKWKEGVTMVYKGVNIIRGGDDIDKAERILTKESK